MKINPLEIRTNLSLLPISIATNYYKKYNSILIRNQKTSNFIPPRDYHISKDEACKFV